MIRALTGIILLLAASVATGQPYVAGGGFDRPWQVSSSPVLTRFAVAGGADGPVVYWSDQRGILAGSLLGEGEPERIAEGRGIREIAAARVAGHPAVAWVNRDLATGVSSHVLSWRGEERILFEALQAYRLAVVEYREAPAVLVARRDRNVAVLRLIGWDGGETRVATSEQAFDQYDAAALPDGGVAVAWLEGFTDREAIGGTVSEWSARFTTVSPSGESAPPITLGPARNLGAESRVAVGTYQGEAVVLWPGAGSELNMWTADGITRRVAVGPASGAGHPSAVGVADDRVFWLAGTSVRATGIPDGGEDDVVNVAWSPVTITGGELAEHDGAVHVAWYGPTTAGRFEVYAADDRQPLQANWQDRMAAVFGWSPWGFWEALSGQLLGSLFAALLVSMALSPLLWLGAVLALRTGWAPSRRTTATGIIVGLLLILSLMAVITVRSRLPLEAHAALFGTPAQVVVCLTLAGLLTWLVGRRRDSEQMIGVIASGWLFLFLSLSGMAFITFQSWVEYWSQVM